MADHRPLRRQPEQSRSRDRVDAILTAATQLIADYGTEPPTMTDIAVRAGMGLTALYRYFPNKRAILRELALSVLELNRQMFITPLVASEGAIDDLIRESIAAYWHVHRDEPFRLRLRVAIQGDAELSALDLADSRRNAQVLCSHVTHLDDRDPAVVERQIFLIISLLDSLMLTAVQLDAAEADTLVEDFATMAISLLRGF